jgi:hypothetical protein
MGRKRQGPLPWVPERNRQFARHLNRLLADASLDPSGLAALLGRTEVGVLCISPRKGIFQALLGQSRPWEGCPVKALVLLGHLDRRAFGVVRMSHRV